jgi:hypothetical protein
MYNTTHLTATESKDASFAKTNGPWVAVLIALGGLFVCWLIFRAWRRGRRERERRGRAVKLGKGRDGTGEEVEMSDRVDGGARVDGDEEADRMVEISLD